MSGTIFFNDEEALAKFLKAFTGSTAVFYVQHHEDGYLLTFTGGY